MTTNIIDHNYLNDLKQLIISFKLLDKKFISDSNKEKILNNMMDSYNKLYLYDMYQGKQLIAVTGLQGAGKTMLVRELFDLPEQLLPENNSRGEKLPIFISEGNISEPTLHKYYSEKTKEGHKVNKAKLSPEEFKEKAMSPNEKEDLWLECIVPSNLLNDDNKIIVLLPGYEKSKRDFSQKLLDFIVQMSNFSILVMNKNTYARKSTEMLMKKIEEKFEGLSPIIALTHGDEAPGQNETIQDSVVEEMEVENPSRVIVTGRTEVLGDAWKDQIIIEMEELWKDQVLSDDNYNESFLEMIEILNNSVEEVIEVLEGIEKNNNINEIIKSTVKTSANTFKENYENYLVKLEKELKIKMDAVNIDDGELLGITKKYSNFLKSVKKIFVKNDLKDSINFRKDIKELWSNDGLNILNKTLDVSNNLMIQNLEKIDYSQDEKIETEEGTVNRVNKVPENVTVIKENSENKNNLVVIDVESKPATEYKNIDRIDFEKLDKSVTNINNYFLQDIKKSTGKLTSLKKVDHDVLVFMGAQFLNNSVASISKSNVDGLTHIDEGDLENVVLNIGQHPVKEEKSLSVLSKSMIAVPVILGLDVAVDGEADIINLAQSSLESIVGLTGLKLSASALSGLSLGILGAGTAAFVVTQVMKDVNNSQVDLFRNGNLLISMLKEAQVKSHIDNQRAIFQRMEEKLIRQESALRGEDELVGQIEESIYLANRVQMKNKEVMAKNYELSLLF